MNAKQKTIFIGQKKIDQQIFLTDFQGMLVFHPLSEVAYPVSEDIIFPNKPEGNPKGSKSSSIVFLLTIINGQTKSIMEPIVHMNVTCPGGLSTM
jgi:hypothetical protein